MNSDYVINVEFGVKYNRTECNIELKQGDHLISLMDGSGGGIVDIASIGLRLVAWTLSKGKYFSTIILDEPFKHLSSVYLESASNMLKLLSDKLGLQIIMVTHIPELIESADRVFNISKVGDSSCVDVL
jgi:DNA repair exonuclease SbcCD ATPase subunit